MFLLLKYTGFLKLTCFTVEGCTAQFYMYKDGNEVFIRRLSKSLNGLNLFKREERKTHVENLATDSSYMLIL